MEKELYTLKDPSMGLEINGVRLGANQLTKKKVIELINSNASYGRYFHLPKAKKGIPPKTKDQKEKPIKKINHDIN